MATRPRTAAARARSTKACIVLPNTVNRELTAMSYATGETRSDIVTKAIGVYSDQLPRETRERIERAQSVVNDADADADEDHDEKSGA